MRRVRACRDTCIRAWRTILILEGSQSDEQGCHSASGTLLINPEAVSTGSWSDEGCVVLIQWNRPVQFLPEDRAS